MTSLLQRCFLQTSIFLHLRPLCFHFCCHWQWLPCRYREVFVCSPHQTNSTSACFLFQLGTPSSLAPLYYFILGVRAPNCYFVAFFLSLARCPFLMYELSRLLIRSFVFLEYKLPSFILCCTSVVSRPGNPQLVCTLVYFPVVFSEPAIFVVPENCIPPWCRCFASSPLVVSGLLSLARCYLHFVALLS